MSGNLVTQLNLRPVWTQECGLVVCLLSNIPPVVVEDPKSHDYANPRLLDDHHIYLGFYPRRGVYQTPLLSKIGINDDDLIPLIEHDPVLGYALKKSVRDDWARVENFLERIAHLLIVGASRKSVALYGRQMTLPTVTPPHLPRHHRYRHKHSRMDHALDSVARSRDAFQMLTAYATFAISLWLKGTLDDCLDLAFAYLGDEIDNPISFQMLDILRDSIVCEFSPGLRPGFFINPYTTDWGFFFRSFVGAAVPVWVLWGPEHRYKILQPRDPHFRSRLFPPAKYITAAQQLAGYIPSKLPTSATNPHTSSLPRGHGKPVVPLPEFADAILTDKNRDLQIDRRVLVDFMTGQLPGEDWKAFMERMTTHYTASLRMEWAGDTQRREEHEKLAKGGHVTKTATVYIWERDLEDPTFYRRKQLDYAGSLRVWNKYSSSQKKFWGHRNEWDIFPMLPGDFDAQMDISSDRYEHDHAPEDYNPDSGFADDEHISSLSVNDVFDLSPQPTQSTAAPLTLDLSTYLYLRHGYTTSENVWEADFHSRDTQLRPLGPLDYRKARGHLAFAQDQTQNPVTDSLGVTNFCNVATNVLPGQIKYRKLDSKAWDLNDTRFDWRKSGFVLVKGKRSALGGESLWIITQNPDTLNGDGWSVATTSASVALSAFRSTASTIVEVARDFLNRGVPFFTVVSRKSSASTTSRPSTWVRRQPGFVGQRPSDTVATAEDYAMYLRARGIILHSAIGRAARLRGGIIGRIARDVVPDSKVLDGPFVANCLVGTYGDFDLFDDEIPFDQLGIICGTYRAFGFNDRAAPAHESFWPREETWLSGGASAGEWLDLGESWFKKQEAEFASGRYKLHKTSAWRDKVKWDRSRAEKIIAGSDFLAAAFLTTSSRSPLLR
ncbi:hypothetical protein BDN72DRAFT_906342 [Pluteus cervinus]|uniref:Uncharacterized protein n=1 Tax=Pluteus cervinus TaxID=181527 RepID=A0ACD2ZZY7_9AGAR|nr:hypothetical protein BDN72DRAFT_906342 [Pluteus cervinus]